MLAYVFWHWPSSGHTADQYEADQRAFHRALGQAAPPGFIASSVFRVQGNAPWLGGAPAYADWYLLEKSAAIDPLNVVAVSGVCEEPHSRVARAMAAGAGSLFALRGDHADVPSTRQAAFLTKPRTMPYEAFYAEVDPHPASLWRRQLVLGPTPEFCVLSPAKLDFAKTFQPVQLELHQVV